MSDVTFTPEQIREIRRRIEAVPLCEFGCQKCNASRLQVLASFPLPYSTQFRTFTMTWGDQPTAKLETYRVNGGRVECRTGYGAWCQTNYGTGSVHSFAEELAAKRRWSALAAFADVCARPVEEVDA